MITNEPNIATMKAIEDIEKEKDLVETENIEDLFRKLDILNGKVAQSVRASDS